MIVYIICRTHVEILFIFQATLGKIEPIHNSLNWCTRQSHRN